MPTTVEPTETAPTTASTTGAAEDTAAEDGTTNYWPLLIALAAAAALLVGVVVAIGRRSAHRWSASFDQARIKAGALARDLAPSLLAGTRESRRGGWEVARPGAVALEDELTALARSARSQDDSTVASDLAAAVRDLRRSIDDAVRAPDVEAEPALQAARVAAQRVEERLAAVASKSAGVH